jgi:hypothetical protein
VSAKGHLPSGETDEQTPTRTAERLDVAEERLLFVDMLYNVMHYDEVVLVGFAGVDVKDVAGFKPGWVPGLGKELAS